MFALVIRALLAAAFVPPGLVEILDPPFTVLPATDLLSGLERFGVHPDQRTESQDSRGQRRPTPDALVGPHSLWASHREGAKPTGEQVARV